MTCAKRDGNDRDFCAAIRVKRKLFKLRAFTVDLQAPQSLSFFFRALSPSLLCPLLFVRSSFFTRPFFFPPCRFPTLASPTLSLFERSPPLYRFCFFSGLPHCIQSRSTKLETAALSALLRLLLSTVPVSPCLLPYFVAFFTLSPLPLPFLSVQRRRTVTLHRVAELAFTSREQVALTVDIGSRFIERAVLEPYFCN